MEFTFWKIMGQIFDPANFFFLLLIGGVLYATSRRRSSQQTGRKLLVFLTLCLSVVAVFPLGQWLLVPLENSAPVCLPAKVDGILVLGGDENPVVSAARDQATASGSARRHVAFVEMARRYPEAKRVFTGGNPTATYTIDKGNASIAHRIFTDVGFPADSVIYEDLSRTTFENARASFDLIKPTPDQNWLIVTSAYHMPRSLATFRKAGWTVYAAPTDYRTTGHFDLRPDFDLSQHLHEMQRALHEYLGYIVYWATGKAESPWALYTSLSSASCGR